MQKCSYCNWNIKTDQGPMKQKEILIFLSNFLMAFLVMQEKSWLTDFYKYLSALMGDLKLQITEEIFSILIQVEIFRRKNTLTSQVYTKKKKAYIHSTGAQQACSTSDAIEAGFALLTRSNSSLYTLE